MSNHASTPVHTQYDRARSFDTVAARYAAARPGYPPALFDVVEELTGRPLRGSHVVDVGAGTGIASRLLHERGARVTAVEPGAGMAYEFRRTLPDVPLVRAVGDALPLVDGCADLITYAQAWHWTDPRRSVPEALRVLRPGGALALWWNVADTTAPWVAAQHERLRRAMPAWSHGAPGPARDLPAPLRPMERTVRWSRAVPLATHLDNLASHSLLLTLGAAAEDVLAQERAALLKVFPDGLVREEYAIELTVTIAATGSSTR
ncbi:class I SAM-dependent methyltransferase [Streptomyces sp. NPDC047315]|uniref:class I SAM-dependent methyltransferase n=1 Tax=Streptomyces sp. NPDC047315 TaxID=3155142 RepID=UPI0033DACE2E